MKFLLFASLFIVHLLCFGLNEHKDVGGIIEVESIIKKMSIPPEQLLVVFDIDNTVLAMNDALGSDQWFSWKSDQISKANPELFTDLLAWQGILFEHGKMRLTEKMVAEVIINLQRRGISVIALTSRGVDYRSATQRELRVNGVDFNRTAIGKPFPGEVTPKGFDRKISYSDGIFMTSGLHKGEMLKGLLKTFYKERIPFSQIVFIDDHQKNTTRVFESFKNSGIEIASYRYGAEDELVRRFQTNNGIKSVTTKKLMYLRETLIKVFKNAPRMI